MLISIFSVLLWVFISLSDEYFYNVKLPIQFTDIPSGFAVSNYSEDEISISLKGQGWQLAQLTFGSNPEFNLSVDQQPGTHTVSLRNALDRNRWLSSSVQINEFSPTELTYKIEEVAEKKLPVVPDIDLKFKEGFGLISEIVTVPESVVVSGPQSLIEDLDNIRSVRKTYSALDRSVVENLHLNTIENLNFDEEAVKVSFNVQKIVDKEFQNIPVEIVNIPPSKNLTVYPDRVNVILKGGINVLGKLDKSEIKVSVSFNQAIKDTLGYLVPQVEAPKFTEFVDTQPNRLEYIIQQL